MDYQCTQSEEIERQREYERLEIEREKSMQEFTDTFKEYLERMNIQRKEEEKRIFEEAARQEEEKRIAKEKEASEIHLGTSKDSLESSVKDHIPIPSESNDTSNGARDSLLNDDKFQRALNDWLMMSPINQEEIQKDEFKYFSNPLFDLDDEIITNEKILPNQKDLDVVIPSPPGIDERCFKNADRSFENRLQNREIPIDSTKIDSIFDEFYLPRPSEIPSFSQDEMDLVFDDSIPPGIDDDDDSEGDILFVEPVATMENNIKELNEDESLTGGVWK
ncbi:hypothetical protein Tco_0485186 [Tanacetum coccineum]